MYITLGGVLVSLTVSQLGRPSAFGAQQCLSLHYCLQQGWFLPPMGAQVADFFNGCMTFLFMLYFYIFRPAPRLWITADGSKASQSCAIFHMRI